MKITFFNVLATIVYTAAVIVLLLNAFYWR